MNRLPITAVCVWGVLLVSPALAQSGHAGHADHAHAEPEPVKPVNAMCPIGKEPIEESGGLSVYKGKTIGFCCPGCSDEFNAWEESAKDEFVAMAMLGTEPGMDHADASKGDGVAQDAGEIVGRVGDPYMLTTCPISGERFGGMGDPIVKLYEGREVRFCCSMCVPKFEKDLKASLAKLDQQIIESQLPLYPMTTCVVSGEELGGDDMGEPINYVYNNRLVRFCCKMCKSDFEKDPEAYIAKLDAAVIAQQGEHYPLATCPISGEELGTMGDLIQVVYGGRLVKFCCEMCVPEFEANPTATIEMIDAAWMAMHENHGHEHGVGHYED